MSASIAEMSGFERERSWPRWLCALTGHQPIELWKPGHDSYRCLCGSTVVSRMHRVTQRYQSSVVMFREDIVAWLWRVLP